MGRRMTTMVAALALVLFACAVSAQRVEHKRMWIYAIDAVAHSGIDGAYVTVSAPGWTAVGVTDRHGRFIVDAPLGTYELTVFAEAPGYLANTEVTTITVDKNAVPQAAVYLLPLAALRGVQ